MWRRSYQRSSTYNKRNVNYYMLDSFCFTIVYVRKCIWRQNKKKLCFHIHCLHSVLHSFQGLFTCVITFARHSYTRPFLLHDSFGRNYRDIIWLTIKLEHNNNVYSNIALNYKLLKKKLCKQKIQLYIVISRPEIL